MAAIWNLMVDIESAATTPDALVLSAATQEFVIEDGDPKLGAAHVWVPDVREQLALGRRVDHDTMKWWRNQDTAAIQHWRYPGNKGVTLGFMCNQLIAAVVEAGGKVWAHGSTFDICVLEDLLKQCGLAIPWKYNAVRDVRTIVRECKKLRDRPVPSVLSGIKHEPLCDCINQIYELAEYVQQNDA